MAIGVICALTGLSVGLSCFAMGCWLRQNTSARRRKRLRQELWVVPAKRKHVSMALLFQRAGYRGSPLRLYVIMVCLGLMGFSVGSALHLFPLVSAMLAAALAWGMPRVYLRTKAQQRQQAFLGQLPSALELMANGMRAGLGINSACEVIAREMKDPLGREFSLLVGELQLGANVDTALEHLAQRNPSGDVRLLSQAILLHKQVGGNLAEVLDKLDETIRERFWLQREIKSTTAEQRLSAVILGVMPLFVGSATFLLNRDYILTLFTTKLGHYFLMAAGMLWLVGIFSLRRILRVEY